MPLGPIMQHIDEKELDALDLYIFPDQNNAICNYEIIDDELRISLAAELKENKEMF